MYSFLLTKHNDWGQFSVIAGLKYATIISEIQRKQLKFIMNNNRKYLKICAMSD